MRRAKIVATIGPAISSYENLSEAIRTGMNVARLNMSHGDRSVHDTSYENLRRDSAEPGRRSRSARTSRDPRSGSAASRTARTSCSPALRTATSGGRAMAST